MKLSIFLTRRMALRRERAALLRLDDHLLADIGLTRTDAAAAWPAPAHWRADIR